MSEPAPRIRAPELASGLDWFNVAQPLTLRSLRGKVVLLDFWTYGCINCMHVLPDLRRLEEKYRAELVVIGVHSAKFTNERVAENLRRVLVRYDVDHPVVNDASFAIWKAYGARAWPTQVLIDPEGYVVATASGEGKAEALDRAIAAVVHVFDERGAMDRTPIRISPERERIVTGLVAFPGKVLADARSRRLFIADSNHHRVLVCDFDGTVRAVIGSGRVGRRDGLFVSAEFYRPQGLALGGNTLFIADTENHLVRAADLDAGTVRTVAGTGRQAGWGGMGGAALETPLNSPWDLVLAGRLLFVAMAGAHQVWVIDLQRGLSFVYAGSGREARHDGTVDEAAFAQPSGVVALDGMLFVADSESSLVRAVALPPVNQVRTLAGGDLFEFGDRDGRGDTVRFQHPLGITGVGGLLFVADTYNHKIRTVDPRTGDVRTYAGTGEAALRDGDAAAASFSEPGGVSAAETDVFVADTNNHAIRRICLRTRRVETLDIRGA